MKIDISRYRGRDHIVTRVGEYPNDIETIVAITQSDKHFENCEFAERLVDCWNACEGLNPEAIPLMVESCEAAAKVFELIKILMPSEKNDFTMCIHKAHEALTKVVAKAKGGV